MERKVDIPIKNMTPENCECGCSIFVSVFKIRKVSRILTGALKDNYVKFEVLICDECGTIHEGTNPLAGIQYEEPTPKTAEKVFKKGKIVEINKDKKDDN